METRRIEERLRDDLGRAMKARDRARVNVLRTALAAIANAEAPPVNAPAWPPLAGPAEHPRLELTEADVRRILEREVTERQEAAAAYVTGGRAGDAETLDAEVAVLRSYLG